MTRIERVKTALSGGVPDRIPVIVHNFLMAAQEAGVSMAEFRGSADVIVKTMTGACIKYDTDGILLDVDTALLSSACGASVIYPENIAAVTLDKQKRSISQIIDDLENVNLLDCDRIKIYLEAINKLSAWCNSNDVFLRANADQGPFSLACLLVGINDFLMSLMDEDEEENLMVLMEQTSKIALQMHRLCYEAGGHCTSYGNSSEGCSVVSPAIFRKFGKPFEIRLHQELAKEGIPTMCHICGWTDPILPDLAETGCQAYEFDDRTDIQKAKEVGFGHFVVSGNVDPVLLANGIPEEVTNVSRRLLDLYRGQGGLLLGAGCALSPNTPAENLHAFVNAAKEYG